MSQAAHSFDGVDLDRLGSHSLEKTYVTLFKTAGISTAVVACLTGTSERTIDAVYDIPTTRRQRQAAEEVLGGLAGQLEL